MLLAYLIASDFVFIFEQAPCCGARRHNKGKISTPQALFYDFDHFFYFQPFSGISAIFASFRRRYIRGKK